MGDITLIIRTADRSHKAEVTVEDTQTCGDIIQAAVGNWAMDKNSDYTVVDVTKTPPLTLNPSSSLSTSGVVSGDTLEVQPVLVAGL